MTIQIKLLTAEQIDAICKSYENKPCYECPLFSMIDFDDPNRAGINLCVRGGVNVLLSDIDNQLTQYLNKKIDVPDDIVTDTDKLKEIIEADPFSKTAREREMNEVVQSLKDQIRFLKRKQDDKSL